MSHVAPCLVALTLSLWLGGCVHDPASVPARMVFGPADDAARLAPLLEGTWEDGARALRLSFAAPASEEEAEGVYAVRYEEPGAHPDAAPAQLLARVTDAGAVALLDLTPGDPQLPDELYRYHLLPVHTVYRMEIVQDTLRLSPLDEARAQALLGDAGLSVEATDEGPLLTAQPEALRNFIAAHAEALFAEPTILTRR